MDTQDSSLWLRSRALDKLYYRVILQLRILYSLDLPIKTSYKGAPAYKPCITHHRKEIILIPVCSKNK